MFNEGYEQWIKLNNKLMMEWYQHTAQQNLEIFSESVSLLSEQLKRLSKVHKPEELINEQRNILNEDVSAAMETMQKVMHANMESMEEMTKLCGTLCNTTSFQKKQTEKSSAEKHG